MNQQKQIENKESEALERLSVQVNSLLQIDNLKETKSQTQKMEEETVNSLLVLLELMN